MAIRKELLDQLAKKREESLWGGGKDKVEARHAKGLLSARERVHQLFDPATFQEMGLFAQHGCHDFGLAGRSLPGDGVITGIGHVRGQPVATFSQDFTVGGGALGKVHAQKTVEVMQYALKTGIPVVGFNDSGGARIQEGVDSLSGYGDVFYHNVLLSGVVPQIAVIAGPCAGGGAYSPALCDFMIMTQSSNMFICGPNVIKAATGEDCTMDEIGTAAAHASISGNIHFVARDDRHAIAIAQQLLSYLPPNNMVDPPHHLPDSLVLDPDPRMNELVPERPKEAIDVHEVIRLLVDHGEMLEVQAEWARNIVVGFARIQGMVVGIVANQPKVLAGSLDINASDKASRFIRFCNAFSIPLVSLVDVPGFLPGVQQEQGGIIRHGAKMLFSWASATVPKITVIMRKAYGGAYLAMCSKAMGADFVYAWPTAEVAVMGAEGAISVLFKKELDEAPDRKAKLQELSEKYRDRFAAPWQAAENNKLTDVIEPAQTRAMVALALFNTLRKREQRPPKKHGNISL